VVAEVVALGVVDRGAAPVAPLPAAPPPAIAPPPWEPEPLPLPEEPEPPVLPEAPLDVGEGITSAVLPRNEGSKTIWLTVLSKWVPSPKSRLTLTWTRHKPVMAESSSAST